MKVVLFVCCYLVVLVRRSLGQSPSHVAVEWDFRTGLEGWAQSSWEEIGAEIYAEGGELRGRVQSGQKPTRFDSPLMQLQADDKYVVGMRVKYGGATVKKAAVMVRLYDQESFQIDFQSIPVEFGGGHGRIVTVPFQESVVPDGRYQIIYAPIHKVVRGTIVQLRLLPVSQNEETNPEPWSTFEIDWIKLIKAPTIEKVEGCINKYFSAIPIISPLKLLKRPEDGEYVERGGHADGFNEMETHILWGNDDKHLFHKTVFQSTNEQYKYATTYNCPRDEGLNRRIRITGKNFGAYNDNDQSEGTQWDTIHVDGQPCRDITVIEQQHMLECTLPMTSKTTLVDRVDVTIRQPDHRSLIDTKPYLSYAVSGPKMPSPNISNVATHSIDLNWDPPSNIWDAVSITGYKVTVLRFVTDPYYREPNAPASSTVFKEWKTVSLGNVTSTTITDLDAQMEYQFRIQSIVEDQENEKWLEVDLYGRREMIQGGLLSVISDPTSSISTLGHDFEFQKFNANATLEHGPIEERSTVGPTRSEHGEGHYGLNLVGTAHVENCNASTACCDFDEQGNCHIRCTNIRTLDPEYVNMRSDRVQTTNDPSRPDSYIMDTNFSDPSVFQNLPQCGPALRLTDSSARATGGAWYTRKLNVNEGFSTVFKFRLSNPSQVCKVMDDVATRCRSRGGDGFAFVIQNDDPFALGVGGMDLGYGGINNALVVEFDTYYNHERLDLYENHVSILAKGESEPASASHKFELAGSSSPVDLTDGTLTAKIVYHPILDEKLVLSDAFVVNSYVSRFMGAFLPGDDGEFAHERAEIATDELGNSILEQPRANVPWLSGIGAISVYVNDMTKPLVITAVNLNRTVRLDSGRAWVGFTASTGNSIWQTHDITYWHFDSLRDA